MIAYASRTGTKRNLTALRNAGWRLLVSAAGVLRTEGFRYALDNGAWTAFQEWQKGLRTENLLDIDAFERAVAMFGAEADWIALPDIVMGGQASLELSLAWLKKLRRRKALAGARFMLVVQNGMDEGAMLARIKRVIGPRVGVFVGGDTDWKLSTMSFWASLAHERQAICHIGRVNTARRVRLCEIAEADSFDGTSASMYAITLPALDRARRQADLWTSRRVA